MTGLLGQSSMCARQPFRRHQAVESNVRRRGTTKQELLKGDAETEDKDVAVAFYKAG